MWVLISRRLRVSAVSVAFGCGLPRSCWAEMRWPDFVKVKRTLQHRKILDRDSDAISATDEQSCFCKLQVTVPKDTAISVCRCRCFCRCFCPLLIANRYFLRVHLRKFAAKRFWALALGFAVAVA